MAPERQLCPNSTIAIVCSSAASAQTTLECDTCESCNGTDDDDDDLVVFQAGISPHKQQQYEIAKRRRYLLYDVSMTEGFNLRRDVYLRVANLVRKLRQHNEDWVLVLPPWGRLYHWKSQDIGQQIQIPWSAFFDIDSLNKHVDVMEFHDFRKKNAGVIDFAFQLQHFEDTFKDGIEWVEKVEEKACLKTPKYMRDAHGNVHSWFWDYNDVYAKNFSCLSLQGQASTLVPVLLRKEADSILLDGAEVMLHDHYGNAEYWKARRSMRFAKRLRQVGDDFRLKFLNSSDFTDKTEITNDWLYTNPPRNSAIGGPYVAVHLRRQDFTLGRLDHVPSLKNASKQIKKILKRLNMTLVFVATDAPEDEFVVLNKHLKTEAVRYIPTKEEKQEIKDGGIAIVDQWICAHARYFVGTHESTFSFRIQEEREILGFSADSTFNRLCGDKEKKCEQPTRWLIVYD